MNKLKKLVAIGSLMAMLAAPVSQLSAQQYCTDAGGYCYEECRRAPCIAPAIALGTIALVAIIAVAIQNSSHSHGHGHCHGDNN